MQLLPVIDVLRGIVVRGVGGRRDEYQPLQSKLAAEPNLAAVAGGFRALGLERIYVADLDAIGGLPFEWQRYQPLLDDGFQLWIDAGISAATRLGDWSERIAQYPSQLSVIAGLESSPGPEHLAAAVQQIGPPQLVFSLDLKAGQPLARGDWSGLDPKSVAARAVGAGTERMIILDLARVGESTGVGTEELCRSLLREFPRLELTAGGGVRSAADLAALEQAGCRYALVASALHDGRLDPAAIKPYSTLNDR